MADRRLEASESIATRFDGVMNAATSPRGWLTDLSLAAAVAAVPLVLFLRQAMFDSPTSPIALGLLVLALAPVLVAVGTALSLRSARESVVDFLASLPFPVENLNSLLAGVTDEFVVVVPDCVPLPERRELQPKLDVIHEDTLLTETHEDCHELVIKIGVVQKTYFPLRAAHRRYARFQRVLREVVVPLAGTVGVERVRIC